MMIFIGLAAGILTFIFLNLTLKVWKSLDKEMSSYITIKGQRYNPKRLKKLGFVYDYRGPTDPPKIESD